MWLSGGALTFAPRSHWFDFYSGYMLRLPAPSPVVACRRQPTNVDASPKVSEVCRELTQYNTDWNASSRAGDRAGHTRENGSLNWVFSWRRLTKYCIRTMAMPCCLLGRGEAAWSQNLIQAACWTSDHICFSISLSHAMGVGEKRQWGTPNCSVLHC